MNHIKSLPRKTVIVKKGNIIPERKQNKIIKSIHKSSNNS